MKEAINRPVVDRNRRQNMRIKIFYEGKARHYRLGKSFVSAFANVRLPLRFCSFIVKQPDVTKWLILLWLYVFSVIT